MIQTLNISYSSSSSSSKTDEIMSRYRPIAPKPEIIPPTSTTTNQNNNNNNVTNNDTFDNGPLVPEKFRQSPYLRNMWSHLQARPTRTRKRGRSSGISATAAASLLRKQQHQQQHQQHQQQHKQQQQYQPAGLMGLCSARNMSMQAFGVYQQQQQQQQQQQHEIINSVDDKNKKNNNGGGNDVVELQLLCCPMLSSKSIDLNSVAVDVVVPSLSEEEMDLQLQLQLQVTSNKEGGARGVIISPRPVRPVGSTISIVGPINEDLEARALVVAAPEQVEAEVEAESLPAVISDRSNKVRMANSAYKELVGQPECPWLDEMCTGGRISGEVVLLLKSNDGLTRLSSSSSSSSSNGFSCWVKIEWESDKKEKKSVNAFCDVVKLVCLSKDYVYSWRFHTKEGSTSCASKV